MQIFHILLLEDDAALAQGIQLALEGEKLSVTKCRTIAEGEAALGAAVFDLVILDINLPDGSGLAFLQKLREGRDVPVILLTANDLESDIVTGLESGADDYITKPFSLAVLRARVNARLRSAAGAVIVRLDDFVFDFEHMEYRKAGRFIDLSKTEQRLLRALVANRGMTVSRDKLVDWVWTDGAEYVDENALSVTVKRLRDKLEENPSRPVYIKTVYGLGYTWVVK